MEAAGSFYKDWFASRGAESNEEFIETANGLTWLATYDEEKTYNSYQTYFDKYLDGVYRVAAVMSVYGNPDDPSSYDEAYYESIVNSIINTLEYTTDYDRKADISDAVYSGNTAVKWPFEIPFEEGAVKAERCIAGSEVGVKFTYEDPVREGLLYTAILDSYSEWDSNDESYLDHQYFGDDPVFKDSEYEKTEIAGCEAASGTDYGISEYGTGHEIMVDMGPNSEGRNVILTFNTYSRLDREKAEAAKEKSMTDFSWLTEGFDTGADDYSKAKADAIVEAIAGSVEIVR